MAALLGLAVRIIAVGPVVSLVLFVVLINSGDVFLVCFYSDLFDCRGVYPSMIAAWIGVSGSLSGSA